MQKGDVWGAGDPEESQKGWIGPKGRWTSTERLEKLLEQRRKNKKKLLVAARDTEPEAEPYAKRCKHDLEDT